LGNPEPKCNDCTSTQHTGFNAVDALFNLVQVSPRRKIANFKVSARETYCADRKSASGTADVHGLSSSNNQQYPGGD
jgi:hypothetical protein